MHNQSMCWFHLDELLPIPGCKEFSAINLHPSGGWLVVAGWCSLKLVLYWGSALTSARSEPLSWRKYTFGSMYTYYLNLMITPFISLLSQPIVSSVTWSSMTQDDRHQLSQSCCLLGCLVLLPDGFSLLGINMRRNIFILCAASTGQFTGLLSRSHCLQ